jgi:hypothetical protein
MTTEHLDQPAQLAVRAGQLVPVTCRACGCRLEAVGDERSVAWFHYGRISGRDARGDQIACLDAPHDAEGRAALAA